MTGRVHARLLVRRRGAAAVRRRLEFLALRGDGTAATVRGNAVAAVFDQALAPIPEAMKQQMEEARTHEQADRYHAERSYDVLPDGEQRGGQKRRSSTLIGLERFEEARSLLRKTIPVARRVLGDSNRNTLMMRWLYARALFEDPAATLDYIREAVTTLEDAGRIARRVFGGAHPTTEDIDISLRISRAALRARETPSPGSS